MKLIFYTGTGNPFVHLGAGSLVFGSKPPTKTKSKEDSHNQKGDQKEARTAEENVENAQGADDEYDPHYEPIVPLPDAIVVTTGEEEEEIVFNERAKLYRYDADLKEWKERGVGQLKVLHHPIKCE